MNKIGILCAVDKELAPFLSCLQQATASQKALLTFHEGTIGDRPVVILACGVGKTNAAIAAQILIDTYQVDAIINAGTAGGMDESLHIFDTVVATEVAHHDVAEGILTGSHPWLASPFFSADSQLLAWAAKAADHMDSAYSIHFGRMVTGEAFIADEGREAINTAYAPLSVDMETASMAQVCHANGVPFLSIRTITDTADHSGTSHFEENVAKASALSRDLVLALLTAAAG